jgi:hypothetical protein
MRSKRKDLVLINGNHIGKKSSSCIPNAPWKKFASTCWKSMGSQQGMAYALVAADTTNAPSARMFRSRLKTWNVMKNWKSEDKNVMLRQLSKGVVPESTLAQIRLDEKKRRKLKRYVHAMLTVIEEPSREDKDPDNYLSSHEDSESDQDDADIDVQYASIIATPSSVPELSAAFDSFSIDTDQMRILQLNMERLSANLALAGVGSGFSTPPLSVYSTFNTDGETELNTLENVLRCIRALFSGRVVSDQPTGGPTTKFWGDIGYAIYLLKVSSPARAWPTFDRACNSISSLDFDPSYWVQAMLTLLSPVNTKYCPELRIELLHYVGSVVEVKYSGAHPVATMAKCLLDDGQSREISERSLRYMLELFTSQLGPCHARSVKVHTELVRLIRRDGDLPAAHRIGQQLLEVVQSGYGITSLEARKAARVLEHVLMDNAEWKKALQLCFFIVGQDEASNAAVAPSYTDECAIYTMEDISKIYGTLGDVASSVVWLEKAILLAWAIRPVDWIGAEHISDKLDGVLRQCGRAEEADIWRTCSSTYVMV